MQNGQQLYRHIYLGCKEEDNVQKNYELLYTSLALMTIELANEDVVIDLIRLAIALQVCFSYLPLSFTETDTFPKGLNCKVSTYRSKLPKTMITFIFFLIGETLTAFRATGILRRKTQSLHPYCLSRGEDGLNANCARAHIHSISRLELCLM